MSKLISLKIDRQINKNYIETPSLIIKDIIQKNLSLLKNEKDEDKILLIENNIKSAQQCFFDSLLVLISIQNLNENENVANILKEWIFQSQYYNLNESEVISFILCYLGSGNVSGVISKIIDNNISEESIIIILKRLISEYKFNTIFEFLYFCYFKSNREISFNIKKSFSLLVGKKNNFYHLFSAKYLNFEKNKYISLFIDTNSVNLNHMIYTHNFKYKNTNSDISRFKNIIDYGLLDNNDNPIKFFDLIEKEKDKIEIINYFNSKKV